MISCHTCGFENADGTASCGRCGTVLPYSKPPEPEPKFPKDIITHLEDHPPSRRALISMVLGLASILLLFFTGICSPLTGIFGAWLGKSELKAMMNGRYSKKGEFYCQVGVWAGWITSCMSLLLLALSSVATFWFVHWFKEAFTR